MNNRGFTLLEMMVAVSILVIVMGTLAALSLGFANASELQELRITGTDEARKAFLGMAPRLRQASRASVNWAALPGDRVSFQVPVDLDGNGFAVDSNGDIELSGQMVIERDRTDMNGDGITLSQLVFVDDAGNVRVLANDLQEEPVPAGAGDDIPDGVGFWVTPRNGGLLLTVRAEGTTRRGRVFTTTVSEFIFPRNAN